MALITTYYPDQFSVYVSDINLAVDSFFSVVAKSESLDNSYHSFQYRILSIENVRNPIPDTYTANILLYAVSYSSVMIKENRVAYMYSVERWNTVKPHYRFIRIGNGVETDYWGSVLDPADFDTGNHLNFLYQFGLRVSEFSTSAVNRLLSLKIGSSDFLTLVSGSGFFVYCFWVLAKFVV